VVKSRAARDLRLVGRDGGDGRRSVHAFLYAVDADDGDVLGHPDHALLSACMAPTARRSSTYQPLILPGSIDAFSIFWMRQTIAAVPDELLDAGRMDRASEFGVFARIVVPSSVRASPHPACSSDAARAAIEVRSS
jgi:hypothetical protein